MSIIFKCTANIINSLQKFNYFWKIFSSKETPTSRKDKNKRTKCIEGEKISKVCFLCVFSKFSGLSVCFPLIFGLILPNNDVLLADQSF